MLLSEVHGFGRECSIPRIGGPRTFHDGRSSGGRRSDIVTLVVYDQIYLRHHHCRHDNAGDGAGCRGLFLHHLSCVQTPYRQESRTPEQGSYMMKRHRIFVRLCGIGLALVAVVGCGRPYGASPLGTVTGTPTPLVAVPTLAPTAARSSTTSTSGMPRAAEEFLKRTNPEELAKQAALVIMGMTGQQTSGTLPPGSPLAPPEPAGEPPSGVLPYTETAITVERTLKGPAPGASVQVRTLGGPGFATTHTPQLRPGQHVVLFLKQVEPSYYIVLGEDGVYEIVGAEASGPRHRYPVGELLARIQGATK